MPWILTSDSQLVLRYDASNATLFCRPHTGTVGTNGLKGIFSREFIFSDTFFWFVLAGFGWFWVVLGEFGSFCFILAGFG